MRYFYLALYLIICMISSLQSEIIEIKNFQEIKEYVDFDTLVVLDIDDTLLIPVQTLGTDVWFLSRVANHLETKKDPILAFDRALAEWEAIRHITDVKIVEEGTAQVIDEMQEKKMVIMGLTTQGLSLSTRTVKQLKALSIDLTKTAPSDRDHYFINGTQGVLYRDGILFTAGSKKGEALLKLCEAIGYQPKKVVFINDKKTHLLDVEKTLLEKNREFIGLRYGYRDEKVAGFSKEIADIQWNYSTFDHLISDEEAADLLHKMNLTSARN